MMNIRTYFNHLYDATTTEAEWLEVMDYEAEVFEMEDLQQWAIEHDVDLSAVDENTGETYLQLWVWDWDED